MTLQRAALPVCHGAPCRARWDSAAVAPPPDHAVRKHLPQGQFCLNNLNPPTGMLSEQAWHVGRCLRCWQLNCSRCCPHHLFADQGLFSGLPTAPQAPADLEARRPLPHRVLQLPPLADNGQRPQKSGTSACGSSRNLGHLRGVSGFPASQRAAAGPSPQAGPCIRQVAGGPSRTPLATCLPRASAGSRQSSIRGAGGPGVKA
mmetsp:Transcript_76791/g.217288  ORF Transcript_76791/g.217288 Transcript_76791/m.217288 type:complete len:203 (+) Transcript_76791:1420-2028(+)